MPTEVRTSPVFRKRYDALVKKYPALENEYEKLLTALENDERPGDKIPRSGHDTYKVRLKNPSARKGKSGGFRVIYYVRIANRVYLLLIYSKSDESDISTEANELLRRKQRSILIEFRRKRRGIQPLEIKQIIKDILASEDTDEE